MLVQNIMIEKNDIPLVAQILACPSYEPVARSVPSPCTTDTKVNSRYKTLQADITGNNLEFHILWSQG